jgi:hypothetical protein
LGGVCGNDTAACLHRIDRLSYQQPKVDKDKERIQLRVFIYLFLFFFAFARGYSIPSAQNEDSGIYPIGSKHQDWPEYSF